MTDEQKELLKQAGILKEDYENCYISEDGKIFTPLKNETGIMIKTGEEYYNEIFLTSPTQQPTKEELLEKQLLETQATLASLQEQILLNNGGM